MGNDVVVVDIRGAWRRPPMRRSRDAALLARTYLILRGGIGGGGGGILVNMSPTPSFPTHLGPISPMIRMALTHAVRRGLAATGGVGVAVVVAARYGVR